MSQRSFLLEDRLRVQLSAVRDYDDRVHSERGRRVAFSAGTGLGHDPSRTRYFWSLQFSVLEHPESGDRVRQARSVLPVSSPSTCAKYSQAPSLARSPSTEPRLWALSHHYAMLFSETRALKKKSCPPPRQPSTVRNLYSQLRVESQCWLHREEIERGWRHCSRMCGRERLYLFRA